MKNMRIIQLLIGLSLLLYLASCEYEFIDQPPVPPPNPTDTIKFSADILPVFNTNNNCTACHTTGNQAPDLTEANAYNSITSMNLVDVETPEASILYDFPRPGSPTHEWKKYTQKQSENVLNWIRQGALNN
jgi:hypothetical protein